MKSQNVRTNMRMSLEPLCTSLEFIKILRRPMEMSSKRPVPRLKPHIEDKRPVSLVFPNVHPSFLPLTQSPQVPRDPRFLPIAGEYDPDRYRAQYGFLAELHEEELKTLRENLKRARKMLSSSPRDLRQEREEEVQRLERAVKRAESLVNKDKRDKIEQSALSKLRKDESEKRKQGKKAWYMKNGTSVEFLARAREPHFSSLSHSSQLRRKSCSLEPNSRPWPNQAGAAQSKKRLRRSRRRSIRRRKRRDRMSPESMARDRVDLRKLIRGLISGSLCHDPMATRLQASCKLRVISRS